LTATAHSLFLLIRMIRLLSSIACCFFLLLATHAGAGVDGKLLAVTLQTLSPGMEDIAFSLDRKTFPDIMILDGKKPRVVYDFIGFSKSSEIRNHHGPGALIGSLRLGLHNEPRPKIRGVLDMEPGTAYRINHFFDPATNIFHATVITTDDPIPAGKSIAVRFSHEQALPASETVAASPSRPTPAEKKKVPENKIQAATQTLSAKKSDSQPSSLDGRAGIREMRFQKSSEQGEMVLFTMKAFKPPRIHAVESGTGVQVQCDFADTMIVNSNIPAAEKVNGEFIKRILVQKKRSGAETVRVILELAPGKNYDVQQMFFKQDNLFAIILQDLETI